MPSPVVLTLAEILPWLERHGVVLESGRWPPGPRAGGELPPVLVDVLAGGERGASWRAHPAGAAILAVLREVRRHPDVLTCRLVGGRVTYVHRRVWPAVVRLAEHFDPERLAALEEAAGGPPGELVPALPYPQWVSAELVRAAFDLTGPQARALLGLAWTRR